MAMKVHDRRVPDDLFSQFTAHMPECCVEIIVRIDDGVLLARRTNEPAEGEWFWPGSRLYKGEALEDAARRVANEELGIGVRIGDQFGTYNHFWETSAVEGSPSRHTVNVVYEATPIDHDPTVALDDQHDDYRVLTEYDTNLHEYVRLYIDDGDYLVSNA